MPMAFEYFFEYLSECQCGIQGRSTGYWTRDGCHQQSALVLVSLFLCFLVLRNAKTQFYFYLSTSNDNDIQVVCSINTGLSGFSYIDLIDK